MNNDKEISNFTACILAFIVFTLIFCIFWPDKTIPSEEQKPKAQVSTEVNTHVIRCTAYVNDTCTEYKVYSVIKE